LLQGFGDADASPALRNAEQKNRQAEMPSGHGRNGTDRQTLNRLRITLARTGFRRSSVCVPPYFFAAGEE
jgi:hypothetical protein